MIDPRSTRAYKLEKENRELKKEIELLKVNCNIGYEELKVAWKYKSRCKKAIEYVNNFDVFKRFSFPLMRRWEEEQVKSSIDYEFKDTLKKDLLNILQGVDEE